MTYRHPSLTPDQIEAQRLASLSRRRFLRGVGACMAVPALESLLPRTSLASTIAQASDQIVVRAPGRLLLPC